MTEPQKKTPISLYNPIIKLGFVVGCLFLFGLQMAGAQSFTDSVRNATKLDFSNPEIPVFISNPALKNLFDEITTFQFNHIRYQNRNLPSRYNTLLINNVPLAELETNRTPWGILTNLSSRGREAIYQSSSKFNTQRLPTTFGNATFISTHYRTDPEMRAAWSFSNRTHTQRPSFNYQTGDMPNGWNIAADASFRFGKSLTTNGVWTSIGSLAIAAKKSLDKHSFDVSLLFAPGSRARANPSTQEAFDLTGDNLYNPSWGYQADKQRSAKENTSIVPIATAQHIWQIDSISSLRTSVLMAAGIVKQTALNWQNSPNPRPDYYRNLPSFQDDPLAKEQLTHLWQTDNSVSQIDFEQLYSLNRQSQVGAKYIMEDRVRQLVFAGAATHYQRKIKGIDFAAGLTFNYAHELRYKQVNDIMDGGYWLDIDYFLESDDDYREQTQNNLRDPNRHVTNGDRFGYNYALNSTATALYATAAYSHNRFFYQLSAGANLVTLGRRGYYEKENFAGQDSFGKSQTYSALEYNLKAAVEYRLGGRFAVGVAVANQSKAPTPDNLFIDSHYRNDMNPNIKMESAVMVDITATYNTADLSAQLSVYTAQIYNESRVEHYYDVLLSHYCDMTLSGINSSFAGVEMAVEARIIDHLWVEVAAAFSSNRFNSDPEAVIYDQTTGSILMEEDIAYDGLHIPASPQNIGTLSLTYKPFRWIVSASLNLFDGSYVSPAPFRYSPRTERVADDPELMRHQDKLSGGYTLDIFGGYMIEFVNYTRLGIYAGVNNLTNRTSLASGGYQSSRLEKEYNRYTPNPSMFYHALGINFFINVSYTF